MPAYEGKGQPTITSRWFGGLGWGAYPVYARTERSAIRKDGGPVHAPSSAPAVAAIAVPTPLLVATPAPVMVTGAPDSCPPGGRPIAIVVSRDPANGDQKR